MTKVPASVVKAILCETRAPGAILLRGAASIIRGESQNDIDIFVPQNEWNNNSPFGHHRIITNRVIGAYQRKLQLKDAETGLIITIDVFHQVTWRGIPMIDIKTLPTCKMDGIATTCLDPKAEAWLTVIKNVLHGSVTPRHKLANIEGHPTYSVVLSSTSSLVLRFDAAFAKAVWTVAGQYSVTWLDSWRARRTFILLRLLETPFGTLREGLRWFVWRLLQKLFGA